MPDIAPCANIQDLSWYAHLVVVLGLYKPVYDPAFSSCLLFKVRLQVRARRAFSSTCGANISRKFPFKFTSLHDVTF
jgi:hypothetical protein